MIRVHDIQKYSTCLFIGLLSVSFSLRGQPVSPFTPNSAPSSDTGDTPSLSEESEDGGGSGSSSSSSASGTRAGGGRRGGGVSFNNRSFTSNLGQLTQSFKQQSRNRPSSAIQSQILENNSEITQSRKTGKVSALSKQLSRFGLNTSQTNRFFGFSVTVQKKLLSQSRSVLQKLLDLKGFNQSHAVSYFSYSPNTHLQILSLTDSVLLDLLDQQIPEELIISGLTKDKISASQLNNIPSSDSAPSSNPRVLSMGEKLKNSGNSEIYDQLLVLSGGILTQKWINMGETANILLQDYDLSSASSSPVILPGTEVLQNPFYAEISSLYGKLELESIVAGKSTFLAGRRVVLGTGKIDLGQFLSTDTQTLVLSASESLRIRENISYENTPSNTSSRIVHMSGGSLEAGNGLTLEAATSDLVLAARKDILLKDVRLEGAREVALRSLRDITLNHVTIGASNLSTIRAARDLNANGLHFSRALPNIIMEANTIRLSDVHFPAASAVRLNSLKGALDSRYPNFGTAIPAAQQIGRVNFIKNVTSGGNLLNNRPQFDKFGGNITIGKLPSP